MLELIGFRSALDRDACLFVSDIVICLFYFDETGFFSPIHELVDNFIERLRQQDMEFEVEYSAAGF